MTVTYPVNFVCPEGYDFFELSRHNDVIAKTLTSVDLTSAKQNIVDISFYIHKKLPADRMFLDWFLKIFQVGCLARICAKFSIVQVSSQE
jgi:hypothetical protein